MGGEPIKSKVRKIKGIKFTEEIRKIKSKKLIEKISERKPGSLKISQN